MFAHQPYVILIILAAAMFLFIWGRWRFDIVALLALAVSVATGAVPISLVYSGLENPAVITVACMMIISNVISRSGVLDLLVAKLGRFTKKPILHIGILSCLVGVLSAFMNNIGALALIMPIAIRTAFENNRSPSMVLMPIAFASAVGGLTTLIGTPPNLIISAFRQEYTGHPFAMFDYSYVGIPVAIICLVFLVAIGWRLMPKRRQGSAKQLEELYQIQEYITEIKIPETSPLVGKKISDLEKLTEEEFVIVGLIRDKTKRLIPRKNFSLQENDILIVEASTEILNELIKVGKLELASDEAFSEELLKSDEVTIMEAVVPQDSLLDGRSTQQLRLRSRYSINLLGIAREGMSLKTRLHQVSLKAGDIVLLQGETELLRENAINLGLLPLIEREIIVGQTSQMYLPLFIFFIAILLSALQWLPVQIAFSGAVLFMVLFKSLPARLIYSSIEWPIIILLAAMIPVGTALQATGGTELIAHYFIDISAYVPHWFILGGILLITMTLSDFMNNAATAVVMAPIAMSVASALHLGIDPFLMAVSIGASCSFLTPIGHQNNTLVMGPGGYHFLDYIRLGLPLEILILIVSVPCIMMMWPM
ncbi:MAG: SLC13 family permease [Gammaproteobacteria bacterium CG_4_10_14_0_8_um_filter_38_16]|nr:MAG: SLC13 family permease [Gammaproteobacteria bacterium CG_4_10_14_0_8_um_filter_38_16]PJA04159.1 MAG: SLC13 family permease [Gammaproteobacteria bacterium CG_4_10_14_0_2_um_filter_38_22]PJB10100.1 MAG: SLC13 family permease [Gammaproteobacteria bacterium CG_4_9_14_3_um_filter_38_9]